MAARSTLQAELMDDPGLALDATERALLDIEKVHGWAGNGALWRRLLPVLARGRGRRFVLDVGTGNGAVAAEAVRRAGTHGGEITAVGVDRKLAHLVLGRSHGHRQLRVVADALALPLADGAVEVSFSTFFQHHFQPDAGTRVLEEMRRVSQSAAIVVDLRRSPLGGLLGRLVLALLRVGPVASHDGRLSLDQSWTLEDVQHAAPTGATRSLRRCWPFRWALELEPHAARQSEVAG